MWTEITVLFFNLAPFKYCVKLKKILFVHQCKKLHHLNEIPNFGILNPNFAKQSLAAICLIHLLHFHFQKDEDDSWERANTKERDSQAHRLI